MEDDPVGDGAIAAQFVERAQNIQIRGGPSISASAGVAGFRTPHLPAGDEFVPERGMGAGAVRSQMCIRDRC